MIKTFFPLSSLLLLIFRIVYINAEEKNIVFRQYTCIADEELELVDCRLNFFDKSVDEPSTITQSGCFIEKDKATQELRHFCPLQCKSAKQAFVAANRPPPPLSSSNRTTETSCLLSRSFNVVRRRSDWFLWLSRDCLTSESQFDISCLFD